MGYSNINKYYLTTLYTEKQNKNKSASLHILAPKQPPKRINLPPIPIPLLLPLTLPLIPILTHFHKSHRINHHLRILFPNLIMTLRW